MIVWCELRKVLPQPVEKSGMDFFEVRFDTIPVIIKFNTLINRFEHPAYFNLGDTFVISYQTIDVFLDQPDDLIFL